MEPRDKRATAGALSAMALLYVAIFVLPNVAIPAFASLGQGMESVQADKVHVKGSLRSVAAQDYVRHDILAATGLVIREYMSPTGTVFSIVWEGPCPPNLQQILGPYFERMRQAIDARRRRGHGPVSLETSELVLHLWGHARSFRGRAYLRTMVPKGVDINEIQ